MERDQLVERNAICRLSHFRYAYLHATSQGGQWRFQLQSDVRKQTEGIQPANDTSYFRQTIGIDSNSSLLNGYASF